MCITVTLSYQFMVEVKNKDVDRIPKDWDRVSR